MGPVAPVDARRPRRLRVPRHRRSCYLLRAV